MKVSEQELESLAKALDADPEAFGAFADALPDFVWITRADGTPIFFNRAMLEFAGVARGDALAEGFTALLYPDDLAQLRARWKASMETGAPFETEYRVRVAGGGAYRWFLSRARALRDARGAVTHWMGTATDIDAQKRSTENLDFVIQASGLFAAASTVKAVCTQFASLAVQRFADWCFVVLADPVKRFDVAAIAHRNPERVRYVEQFVDRYPVGADEGLQPMLEGDAKLFPVITEEMLAQAARDEPHLELMHELGLCSAIVAGMKHDGELLGGIIIYSAESRRAFTQSDVDVLTLLAARAAAQISHIRTLQGEQRKRRRLQFLGQATQAVYESFDLTTAFGNLARIVVSELADMAAVFRIEDGEAARIVAAAHREPSADDAVRSFVGIRVMHGESEKRFVKALQSRKTLVGRHLERQSLVGSVWPYLSEEIAALHLRSMVTIPLHSRGRVYGALVAYYAENGREYKPENVELLTEIARHASIAMENADVFERERRMSETLQDSLLPPSLPAVPGMTFDAVYLPSATEAQVGGDWYDAYRLEDGTVVVSAGDVTGRGPDAAVIMGKVRHLLAIAPLYEHDPARILDTVEIVLARRYPEVIVTAFLGLISPDCSSMYFANAGHPPPMFRTGSGIEELHAEGLPIGLRRDAAPSSARTVDLRDARMLVLYTDGLTEADHDVLGGYRKLREVVSRDALLHTHRPARFIEEACLGNAASDDVAVLTITFEGGMRWSFDAENAKAAQDARGEFVEYLRMQGGDPFEIATAELVFGELVGNVVRHAPGAIDIDVEWSNGSPRLHVVDRGPAFRAPGHLPDDLLSESGRGLFIVRRLSRELKVEHVPGYGNHVAVELPVSRKRE